MSSLSPLGFAEYRNSGSGVLPSANERERKKKRERERERMDGRGNHAEREKETKRGASENICIPAGGY